MTIDFSNEKELFRLIFCFIFVIAASLLMFLLIRKLRRDKKHGVFYEERTGKITTQQMCSIAVILPSFFEFLMNTYQQLISKWQYRDLTDLNYWYSILDMLFIVCAILVYLDSKIKWSIFLACIVQVYTFSGSIQTHLREGLNIHVVNFFVAFIYYVIVACVLIRVMYPMLFTRTGKVARL